MAFETDVLAGFILARAAAGLSDNTEPTVEDPDHRGLTLVLHAIVLTVMNTGIGAIDSDQSRRPDQEITTSAV